MDELEEAANNLHVELQKLIAKLYDKIYLGKNDTKNKRWFKIRDRLLNITQEFKEVLKM